jgi:hypothetical protein
MDPKEDLLFPEFAARCEEARRALTRQMAERGLHARDGWRIYESIRDVIGRTELVMRPIHSHLESPPDLECVCSIDVPGSAVSSDCG